MIVINMIVPGHGRRLMSADATNLSRDHVGPRIAACAFTPAAQSAAKGTSPRPSAGVFRWRDAGINVCFWHLADISADAEYVCFQGKVDIPDLLSNVR